MSLCGDYLDRIHGYNSSLLASEAMLAAIQHEIKSEIGKLNPASQIPDENIHDDFRNAKNRAMGDADEVEKAIGKSIEHCLAALLNRLQSLLDSIGDFIKDTLDDLFDVLKDLFGFSGLLNKLLDLLKMLDIRGIFKFLDQLLGCAADALCSSDDLDSTISSMNIFADKYSINDNGEFDHEIFIDKQISSAENLPSDMKNVVSARMKTIGSNILDLGGSMQDRAKTIQNNFKQVSATRLKVPVASKLF